MPGKHLELRRNNDINAVCSLLFDAFSPGYGKKSLGLSRVKCVAVGYKSARFVHYWRMLYAGRFFQWRARGLPIPYRAVRHLPRPFRPMHFGDLSEAKLSQITWPETHRPRGILIRPSDLARKNRTKLLLTCGWCCT